MNNYTSGLLPSALLLSMALGLASTVAHADTVMNMTGNIKASPCTVNVPAGGVNVDLGNIQAPTLGTEGQGSPWKGFAIEVKGCPTGTVSATMTLNGTADTTNTDMYVNTGSADNAVFQIQKVGDSTKNLGNGSTVVEPVDAIARNAIFNLQTRAVAKTAVTPGTLVGVVMATFIYQ